MWLHLVEHRSGMAEVMGLNDPVEALIFFRLLLSSCLNWKIYCDDHSSHSFVNLFALISLFIVSIPKKYAIVQVSLFSPFVGLR